MKRPFLGLFTVLFSLGMLLSACGTATKPEESTLANTEPVVDSKIKVYTTLFALTDFAQSIAGDKAIIENIVPAGVEPHDFEPTAKDMIKLNEANVFIYNGAGFEGWTDKALQSLENKDLIVVDASKDIELVRAVDHDENHGHEEHAKAEDHGHEEHAKAEEHGHEEHAKEEDHGHEEHASEGDHDHGEFDPHIWLDPLKAKKQAELIKDALIKADPANKEYYEGNFQTLNTQFDELDAAFKDLVAHSHHKEIVVSHAAFGYLTHAYGLKQIAISGLSPSNEPSQQQLKNIIDEAREHEIKNILFDSLVSGKVAEVVKHEVGAEALTLNTLENLTQEELSQGKNYFSVMKDNIETLKQALEYKK
ncbi:metal ABC transporter substrate-binding protein [Ammoniphilus sp. CFH 90114]|uniref:metal ABC transporter substrate-binding protein n=1 Tax=Ammoniphilus sp. CFH 90114 TaxID=2493665 RepID=UPI00100DA348|nr:metal ABC transporter substrate-binding protein [Ammoniphilus sp. CFH 90114]RXT13748.1 metal ABC transporter substrate-binding protein [Ammoniphilus sp. CFH 90114]